MENKKVISGKNLPSKLPIFPTITAALALDRWNAPEWLIGAVGLFFLVMWIIIIVSLVNQKKVDIFEEPKEEENKENLDIDK